MIKLTNEEYSVPKISIRRGIKFFGAFLIFVVIMSMIGKVFESNNKDTILAVQFPSGSYAFYTTPGSFKPQYFGNTTFFKKRSIYDFEIPIRFNDNGHGTLKGSVQYEMPLDIVNLKALYEKFGSQEAVQRQLVETVVNKAVYLTGSLMSSKESSAERRNDLIRYIEDQIENGVYRTTQRDLRIKDPLNDQIEKTVTVVEIIKSSDGQIARQEKAVLSQFGIKPFNFSIKNLDYDAAVTKQISNQQDLAMQVQTAIAQAKQAEQRAITVEMQGKANAAEAKWQQEVEKAKAVTEAEKERDVAKLYKEKAAFYKEAQILEGQGEAEKKRLIMGADGALKQKLETYEKVQELWANAFQNFKGDVVPRVVMGSGNTSQGNAANTFMELINAKAAKDLAVDLKNKE